MVSESGFRPAQVGAASPAVFDFPSDEPLSSKGGRKRKKTDDTVASTFQQLPEGEEEEEQDDLELEALEDDDSPIVTLLHEAVLKKGQSSVFVAKLGLQAQMNLSSTNRIHTLAKAKGQIRRQTSQKISGYAVNAAHNLVITGQPGSILEHSI